MRHENENRNWKLEIGKFREYVIFIGCSISNLISHISNLIFKFLISNPFSLNQSLGILFALLTTLSWSICIFPFTEATRRLGASPLNHFRLLLAIVLLTAV
jgi:hypothetical protein